MMTGQNIICFANDWDADPTSKHQVMKLLAGKNRVLWVESIGLRRPGASKGDASRILKKIRKFVRGPVCVAPNLYVVTPLAIPFHGVKAAQAFNAWFLASYIRAQASRLDMSSFQLWTFLPTTAPIIRYLKPQKVIYYCVDEWSAFSFLDGRLMEQMETDLIKQSDLVITSAEKLYASKRHLNPRTYLVPHGVDAEHFGKALLPNTVVPKELEGLPKPIIGFWGLIHEWIDIDLIHYAATRRPEWSFVLIGKAGVDCSALKQLPNVYLLGVRSYTTLPAFAKGFSVGIMPFKINRLTENVNPIKLREYLAAGLPVVSTPLEEARIYAQAVRFGSNGEEFVKALDLAVKDNLQDSIQSRLESVKEDTWAARVDQISSYVENVGSRQSRH
jgi:glycosyltransferase involved in cell wall biosynthesis